MVYKISVILPIYNGEKYLGRCLDSILNQTMPEVKIIAVNDGSNDASLSILKEYKKKYGDRIHIHNQENAGVAAARNTGIDLVETKYTMFIDQDDFIDKDHCEIMYNYAESDNYDVVLSGFKRPGAENKTINKKVLLKDSLYAPYVCVALYAKIHKTELLKKNNVRVFSTKYGEDVVFIMHEYSCAHKIKIIENYAGYDWFYNDNSVSNTSQKKIINILPSMMELLNKLKEYDTKRTKEYEYFVLQTVTFYFLWAGRQSPTSDFMVAYRKVFSWLDTNYPNYKSNKYLLFGPVGAPSLNRFSISVFIGLHRLRMMKLFSIIYCKNG